MNDADNHFPRSSGILLHPTSLPSRFGIGDFGPNAYKFVDWLTENGQSLWQVLPLGPTSYGDSPYQTLSACAGNPNLISPELLAEAGWLDAEDLAEVPDFPANRVDFGWVIKYKSDLLQTAFANFVVRRTDQQKTEFDLWCSENAFWLESYAMFCVLKNRFTGNPWTSWPVYEARGKPGALAQDARADAARLAEYRFQQWMFATQWTALRNYANERSVRIIGDLPIFVAHDSADVWANQKQFLLDADGKPRVQAGVPPDYFSKTGQLWGNPLYNWKRMAEDQYQWWIGRFRACLSQFDVIRLDHFRGFDAYWEVPGDASTAKDGKWVRGPGADFFESVRQQLGSLPFIAEDLGVVTSSVEKLRDDFGLPGMKVLQFAWSDPRNAFLIHNHTTNCVVYSGTHDNVPTLSWWQDDIDANSRHLVAEYIDKEVTEPNWMMIRLGMMSPAHTFVATMQDVLGLGDDGCMNRPGVESGNWDWRMLPDALSTADSERLSRLTWLYQRSPGQRETAEDRAARDAVVEMTETEDEDS